MCNFQEYFPGLSKTLIFNFQDFPGTGIFKKKSRTFQEVWEPCRSLQRRSSRLLKTPKTNHENNTKLLAYVNKLKQMKLKPALGVFYAVGPGNGFHLFHSSHGLRSDEIDNVGCEYVCCSYNYSSYSHQAMFIVSCPAEDRRLSRPKHCSGVTNWAVWCRIQ